MNAHGTQPLVCPRCHKPVDVKSRHVSVAGSSIQIYCSDACLRGAPVLEAAVPIRPPRRRGRRWLATIVVLGGAAAAVYAVYREEDAAAPADAPAVAIAPAAPPVRPTTPGPSPEELAQRAEEKARREADEALLKDLMQDAWIHPLAGPQRRMPANHTGAFGAARSNEPPPECMQGHCGVDVGSQWGEPIHAVHDGAVDWVNRGPNDEHGGVFVKIAHRGGALYSWYFHLAAVPRWVQPGVKIKAGDVIGLLGDTGIKQSAPHLHFALTVKSPRAGRERYIDPEPLLALWPLWMPDERRVSTKIAAPGLPVRSADEARPRTAKAAAAAPAADGDGKSPGTGNASAALSPAAVPATPATAKASDAPAPASR